MEKRMDPRKQFSKKLASRTEWFWFFYMTLLVVLLAYRPEVGVVAVYLAILCTIVMTVNVWCYTDNSKFEKALYAARDMAKIKFTWKHKGTEVATIDNVVDEESNDSSDSAEEGESNG